MAWLNEGARRALEEYLDMNGYEFQSDFAKYHNNLGRQDGKKLGAIEGTRRLLRSMLANKFGELDQALLHRIEAADSEQIETWALRLDTASTLDDVFAAAPQ